MHALSSPALETAALSHLPRRVWQLFHAFVPERRPSLPSELRRLSARQLLDIGIDARIFAADHVGGVTPPDVLHSPRAMAEFLATTIR